MRTVPMLLAAVALLASCNNGGDACHQYCEEQATCAGLTGTDYDDYVSDCYDDYSALLAIPTTRPAQVLSCNTALDALTCE